MVERRPSWGRSIVAGMAAVTIGPLVAAALGLTVRALVSPTPSSTGSFTLMGAWPDSAFWGVIVLLLFFTMWLVDAAVRRQVFGMIADADVSLWACVVSALIMPSAWLLDGSRFSLAWSLIAGPVFLRWRSTAPGVEIWKGGTRAGLVRWRVLVLSGAVAVGLVALVVVARAPALAIPPDGGSLSWGSVGGVPLAASHPQNVAPLSAYSGKKVPRALTYRVVLQNNGSLPITITTLTAHVTGHILRLRGVSVSDTHLGVGDQATVAVRMALGSCASPRPGPSVSVLTGIGVRYSTVRGLIHRSEVLKPASGVQLLCPSRATPPNDALLLNVG